MSNEVLAMSINTYRYTKGGETDPDDDHIELDESSSNRNLPVQPTFAVPKGS